MICHGIEQGGGALSAQLLDAIDHAGLGRGGALSTGTCTQLYNYGRLDTSPSTMTTAQRKRSGFWLLPMWAAKDRGAFSAAMKRVAGGITSTFASSYTAEVGLAQAVTLPALRVYATQATGKKYLLNPQRVRLAKL